MSGIAYLRQYCTVIHYQHFKKTWLLFKKSKIWLSFWASFLLWATFRGGFLSWVESVMRSWDCNWIIHLWYKALELELAEEDLVWLALPCTTTDLVTVLTQRTHSPLYVTGTRSCKWTGLIVLELPGSRWATCNFTYISTARCYSKLSSSDCTQRRLQQQQLVGRYFTKLNW